MEKKQLMEILDQYSRQSYPENAAIKITRVPDNKTSTIENIAGNGSTIMMSEYRVNGKIYWAGFSMRTQTVFISQG